MAAKPENKKDNQKAISRKRAKNGADKRRNSRQASHAQEISFHSEVILLVILAVCILLFISNFGIGGFLGAKVSGLSFGLFGLMAYLVPICVFVGAAFYVSNRDNGIAMIKLIAGILFVSFLCLFVELIVGNGKSYSIQRSFLFAVEHRSGGGALGGLLAGVLCPAIGKVGAYVVDVITLIISMVILTERSFLGGVKRGGRKVYDSAKEDAQKRKQVRELRREEEQRRINRKAEGVVLDTKIQPMPQKNSDNISELTLSEEFKNEDSVVEIVANPIENEQNPQLQRSGIESEREEKIHKKSKRGRKAKEVSMPSDGMQEISISMPLDEMQEIPVTMSADGMQENLDSIHSDQLQEITFSMPSDENQKIPVTMSSDRAQEEPVSMSADKLQKNPTSIQSEEMYKDSTLIQAQGSGDIAHHYELPPVSLLKPGDPAKKDNRRQLQETAIQLQQILKNFGVNVTVTDVNCGPSVTRYELQPELGVKVSKIVNLADDIKLNLAAADIRIEAPIPGKAAVGIEVPNKENIMVRFRELIEAPEFQQHSSSICFTAGKDIGGQVVVADIAKMPHLLIAGATGSGKSVCINTIIMSILYKADPEDVKLILIDPKVVELSVYNGIPHLFIPVVTDPKKAAGALHWAVAEMTDRYQKFADYQVRDLKGYNQKVEAIKDVEDETKPKKLPQIVIVVDELADLMMVAPGDVEDAICRLAQLARAAGIHLIIATQRPSVDVITGLIKANMPSRIAFSVSSGVDSRTILDMNGAEKLLGNGDMLFYPQGYQKPLRVQGPFVSDPEVEAVVDFLKKQSTVVYNTEIEDKMNTVSISSGSSGAGGGNDRDSYFVEAGKFVIEKDKGSIGMLQRMFKIGFNRAARIMDQLEEAGVVGPEEGTKPRKILMSLSEFEQYIDECV